jgi:para-aminobenzoate synthetase component 1
MSERVVLAPAGLSPSGPVHVLELTAAPRRDGIVAIDLLLDAIGPADLLESADRSGWSSIVPHDLSPGMLVDDGARSRLVRADGTSTDLGPDPLAAIDAVTQALDLDPCATPEAGPGMAFRGGLLGALAYELGDRIEPSIERRDRDARQPDVMLRVVGTVVAVSRERDRAYVVVDEGIQRATVERIHADLERRCGRVGGRRDPSDLVSDPRAPATTVATSLPHDVHLVAVGDVLDIIARGDAYQVNLAQQLAAPFTGDLAALYRRMRAASPASHAALLPDAGLASISPERFLEVTAGTVITDPIKGTRRRADDPVLDAALADDLTTSTKDRAENVMVVDLERNDLGRVCLTGSVEVPLLLELRALPTVWHLVSRVRGTLRPGTTYGELLRATFPSGSITGAPRIAAMRAIRRLEPVPRGWYCGAVGWFGRGSASLSVAIRTATLRDGVAVYGAGGGIVADSDPQDEVAETLDKAVAFLAAVGATHTAGRLRPPSGQRSVRTSVAPRSP